jgi:high-affinity iron transporter
MLPSYVLALREGIEAALIIGIVLGVLRKMDRRDLNSTVGIGVFSAIIVSFLTAVSLNWIGAEFAGQGEQLFEGITMLLAAGILTWMIFWMRHQASSMKSELEAGVRQATLKKGRRAIFFLAFVAVVREGIELALYLLAARLASNPIQELSGAALGIGSAALLGWGIVATTRRLSIKQIFQYTNVVLILFAAGLVGLSIREFNEAGVIPVVINHVWNLNTILPDESTLGQLLKALVGYDSSPSLSQVAGYLGYFGVLALVLLFRRLTIHNKPAVIKESKIDISSNERLSN